MLLHWIWFATRPGLSDRTKVTILQHFHDAEDVYFAEAEDYRICEGLSQEAVQSLLDKNLKQAEKILGQCAKEDIHILTFRDAGYPGRLKAIADPPVVLYYKGQLVDFDHLPLIGVVGTRKASSYGLTVAKRMGTQLADCGGVVVSGVATGIDAMAMSGALSAGGMVIGVLGCGADVVYPKPNRSLYRDTQAHGCLLTEYPPGTEPFSWNFPKRNRIISGLSCGVLVVEAPERSGALSTARHAAEQGRDVFVIPANIDNPTGAGSNALLRDGAVAVTGGWDVLSEYEALYPDRIHNRQRASRQAAYPDEVERLSAEAEKPAAKVAQKAKLLQKAGKAKKKEIDNPIPSQYIDAEKTKPALSQQEQDLVRLLDKEEALVDDVMAQSGLPAGTVLAMLTMLEVKGVIARLPGNRVKLK